MVEKRQEAVDSAIRFLQDPKVKEASIKKQIAFLQSKGLNDSEIETAQTKATTGKSPPLRPKPLKTQKQSSMMNIFSTMIGFVGVGSGIGFLARYYLLPLIDLPAAEQVKKDTAAIVEQLTDSSTSLELVSTQTKNIIKGMESHALEITEVLDQMNSTLAGLRECDANRGEEIRMIKDDINELKVLLPQLIHKNKENESAMLTELQGEIKSFRNLLMNRRVPGYQANADEIKGLDIQDIPSFAGISSGQPAIPIWQLSTNHDPKDPIDSIDVIQTRNYE